MENSFLDYLIILAKNKWLLIKVVFISVIIGIIVSLLIPKEYKSTAEIIPVSSEGGGISSLLAGPIKKLH